MTTEPNHPEPKPVPEAYGPPAGAPSYPVPPAPYGNQGYQPPQMPYAGYPQPAKTNTLAIIAFISVFFVSLVGIIMGHLALNQIKRTGEGGRGLAIAALVLGYAGVVIAMIVIAIAFGAYSMGY